MCYQDQMQPPFLNRTLLKQIQLTTLGFHLLWCCDVWNMHLLLVLFGLNIESSQTKRIHLCSGTQRAHNSRLLVNDMAEPVAYYCDADQSVRLHPCYVCSVLAINAQHVRSVRTLWGDARRRGKDRRLRNTDFESQIRTKCENLFVSRLY